MMKIYHSKKYLAEQLKKKTYVQIAEKNKVDPSTIHRYLRKYDLTKKRNSWTEKELELLKKNYNMNEELHGLFPNRTLRSVYHKGNKLGLKRVLRKRFYSINHNFFKTWTPEMAYVLGLFFSDGHVSHDKKYISIHLHKKDHYILEKIRKIMGSNRPLGSFENSSQLRLDSSILVSDLISLGCTPRKSLTLNFPKIKENFLSHFVRGYFDGDGSIHFNKPNTIKISFVGTNSFISDLQKELKRVVGTKINHIYEDRRIYVCRYYGSDARKLCSWMYKDSQGLYLKRKRDRFDVHLEKRK